MEMHMYKLILLTCILCIGVRSQQNDHHSKSSSTSSAFEQVEQVRQQMEEQLKTLPTPPTVWQKLNGELQMLSDNYIEHFLQNYHEQSSSFLSQTPAQLNQSAVRNDPGGFLTLLGKMYLYDILPTSSLTQATIEPYSTPSRYILAYFYFKIAATRYQHPEAYYMLGVLEYHKLTPYLTLLHHLKKNQNPPTDFIAHLELSHTTNTEHNFYLSSLLGHNGASLVLATLNKEGIGTDANCSVAAAYFLSIIRNTYVDQYQFRPLNGHEPDFEYELYSMKKANLKHYGSYQAMAIQDSEYIDQETMNVLYEMADNYYVGRSGYLRNYTKAMQLYQKLSDHKHKPSTSMLGMGYFKGQGVPLNRTIAHKLFEQSKDTDQSAYMLTAMKYFGLETKKGKEEALKQLHQKYKARQIKPLKMSYKYLIGSIIAKGEMYNVPKAKGYELLEEVAANGNLFSKMVMALLFLDGAPGLPFQCDRATKYFMAEGIHHPFFIDKLHIGRIGIKKNKLAFSLIKALELAMIGNEESFVTALYLIDVYKPETLAMTTQSWSIIPAQLNKLYKQLFQMGVVPDIASFIRQQLNLVNNKWFSEAKATLYLKGDSDSIQSYEAYLRKKIIKVCSYTTSNSLIKLIQYKMENKDREQDSNGVLKTIAGSESDKAHVLQAKFLLARFEHKRITEIARASNTTISPKDKERLLKQYNRSTKSWILGQIIFYLEEYRLGTISLSSDLTKTEVIQDLGIYTSFLSIVFFIFYYLRSKKLDEDHLLALQKEENNARLQQEERRLVQAQLRLQERHQEEQNQFKSQQLAHNKQKDPNQSKIIENRPSLQPKTD